MTVPRSPLRYRILNCWPPGSWPHGKDRWLDKEIETGWHRSGVRVQRWFICGSCGDADQIYRRSEMQAELAQHAADAAGKRACDASRDLPSTGSRENGEVVGRSRCGRQGRSP